jgi:hypothetical protein
MGCTTPTLSKENPMTNNQQRPLLPANCPDYLCVEVYRSEYRGQAQWHARHRFYDNGKPSDYMTIVVNPASDCPMHEGQEWWVKPVSMAPKARVLFADAYQVVGKGNEHAPRFPRQEPKREERYLPLRPLRAPRYGDSLDDIYGFYDPDDIVRLEEYYNGERPDRDCY